MNKYMYIHTCMWLLFSFLSGWFLLNNGFCRAPENYIKSSKCNDEIGFFNMTSQQKESFSISCNVDFPFKGN